MTSKVHKVRRSFAPNLVNLTYVSSVLWDDTLDKNTCGTFDLLHDPSQNGYFLFYQQMWPDW